jgi:hypothetical protein
VAAAGASTLPGLLFPGNLARRHVPGVAQLRPPTRTGAIQDPGTPVSDAAAGSCEPAARSMPSSGTAEPGSQAQLITVRAAGNSARP